MSEKSGIDKLFDLAESALGGVESALAPANAPKAREAKGTVIDVPSRVVSVDREEDWERTFTEEVDWAQAGAPGSTGEGWHAFPKASLQAIGCHQRFASNDVRNRGPLEHGKRIVACTSCIIAVSRRG